MPTPVSPAILTDSHCHLYDLLAYEPGCLDALLARGGRVVTSCHCRAEAAALADWLAARPELTRQIGLSFGIHPQNPVDDEWDFLRALAANATAVETPGPGAPPPPRLRLAAIGECGWDFWNGREMDGLHGEANQDRVFRMQAELALAAGLPLVLHVRRAIDLAFRHASLLARQKAVVFHSWPAPPEEAKSLLDRGVNAWFSLGTPLLQGNRKALRSLRELPAERLLLETDAPYQTLKGRSHTTLADLDAVLDVAASARNEDPGALAGVVAENFAKVFGPRPGTPPGGAAQAGARRGSPS
jgi:TatD DNase family protein